MKALFLADAHLQHPDDPAYRDLQAFLDRQQAGLDALYLLGDLFEIWAGPRFAAYPPYRPLLEQLRRLRRAGIQVTLVEGNHDFHLAPFFAAELGCRVLPRGGEVTIAGRRVWLAHGDLVNPEDRGYRLLRALLRSTPLRLLAAGLPPDWVTRLAHRASHRSSRSHAEKRRRWDPANLLREHARQLCRDGVEVVITGHFHHPLQERIDGGLLIGLGDWVHRRSYAICEDGRFELRTAQAPASPS